MYKVIAVASGKGGTGKSTISVSLGQAIAKSGGKVLLIDCDCGMRSLDLMLGITKNLVFDMADAASGDCNIEDTIYPSEKNPGLYLVPAPQSADEELCPAVFKQFISAVYNIFDYIIIDSPAGVGKGFETAVSAADVAFVVCNPEPASMRGCNNVKKCLLKCGIENIRLIINKFDEKNFFEMGFYPDLDAVIDTAGIQLIAVIPKDNKMSAAIMSGTIVQHDTKGTKAFNRLARRLKGERVLLAI